MKASMKFRDDQKPILKAKIPISIIGLPFQSGIVAGETKELSLNLSTFFESGPSLKLAYRPNDTWNPFSLIVKTGTGSFGSPISSSMLMSAEFNLVGNGNPRFMLHFKPRFGDFEIKKSNSSSSGFDIKKSMNGSKSEEEDSSIKIVDHPTVSPYELISGVDFAARTVMPLRGNAAVSLRWGIRVTKEMINPTVTISSRKIPFLVMNKIGIEHVDGPDLKLMKSGNDYYSNNSGSGSADVAEACLGVRKKLEELRTENLLLKRSVDDLKEEMIKVCSFFSAMRCDGDEKSEKRKKKGDVAEEVA